jgi:iron complex transport system substrate-binding protein
MAHPEEWNAIPAVQNGRIYALEANSYFSRPGPRLIAGIEALAKLFQPAMQVNNEAEGAAVRIITSQAAAFRAAAR